MFVRNLVFAVVASLAMGGSVVVAQTPPVATGYGPLPPLRRVSQKPYGTLNMKANLGSFKLLSVTDPNTRVNIPGEGQLVFDFAGTVMVNDYKGAPIQIIGNIKKEYEKYGRQAFHGKGRMILEGTWRAVQWFGSDLTLFRWYGQGLIRIVGEFDRDQNIGEYWYEDPAKKFYWYAQSTTVTNPQMTRGPQAAPRERGGAGGG
ncbi:MAG: hypothetical protein KIS66_04550 [Fimbriimonadaceae bacterium]|nr:hypothetical protein [Fimbriimonadaceae bacterium]